MKPRLQEREIGIKITKVSFCETRVFAVQFYITSIGVGQGESSSSVRYIGQYFLSTPLGDTNFLFTTSPPPFHQSCFLSFVSLGPFEFLLFAEYISSAYTEFAFTPFTSVIEAKIRTNVSAVFARVFSP